MRRKTWIFQVKAQIEKHGADKAAWYVGWIDPDGKRRRKSCGPGTRGRRDAERLADRIHSQIVTDTYDATAKATWAAFRAEYESKILEGMPVNTRLTAEKALNNFERLVKPNKMKRIDAAKIDEFISQRKKDKGRYAETVGPATVNRDLRYLKAALRVAEDWGFIARVPRIRLQRVPKKIPTFVPPDHFALIYGACESAKYPRNIGSVDPADWWRALVTFAYLTGWRIGQIMALKWEHIDLEAGTALSEAEDNKGRRDVRIPLQPAIVDHLRRIASSGDGRVFPWNQGRAQLWGQFRAIQEHGNVPREGKNGGRYGFHDLRRGFATANAAGIDVFRLQTLMQHKSLETTRGYINMAESLKETVDGLFVPDILRKPTQG